MPRERNKLLDAGLTQAPDQPHLALFRNNNNAPAFEGIPRGAILAIVENPNDPVRGIFPLAIVRVGKKRLEFQCPCGQSNCTRRVVFNATWSGLHPHGTPEISIK